MSLLERLLDWVYPPTCIACAQMIPMHQKQPRHLGLCHHCQGLFEPILPPHCQRCGQPVATALNTCAACFGKTLHFTSSRGTFLYADVMQDLLRELKFRQNKKVAHSLGKLWALHIGQDINIAPNTTLVPLPLHPRKQRERGFNQAEILAKHIAPALNLTVENTLIRTIDTPPQSGLHPRERVENVANAFALAKGVDVAGKSYVLVDDIYTTGASLSECAKILLNAGAVGVDALCLTVVEKRKDKA